MDLPEVYNLIDIPTDSKAYVFDIEADGFLEKMTNIHCVWSYEVNKKSWLNSADTDSGDLYLIQHLELLQEADYLIGHNIIGYDIPAIQKIYPWFKPKGILVDTLIISQLVYPKMHSVDYTLKKSMGLSPQALEDLYSYMKWDDKKGKLVKKRLEGMHSLMAWGVRLGEHKGNINDDEGKPDWSTWTPEMHEYCKQDVWVNYKVFEKLRTRYDRTTNQAIWVEQEVRRIIGRQIQKGFKFNREKGQEFYSELVQTRSDLKEELDKTFGNIIKREIFIPKVNNKTRGYIKGEPFEKVKEIPFNAGSRDHITYWFKEKYNWEPTEFNPKDGKPKVDGDVLELLPYPEAKFLSKYFEFQKVIAMLAEGDQAWFHHLTKDDRIHGGVNTMGASTGRMTHSSPNLAQIPARGDLGHTCRELFVVSKGYKLVGCDASGLELRCLAHYMNDPEYTKVILEGDIHTENQMKAGLPTRDNAKTFIYGFLYGAGNAKIGSIVGKGAKVGGKLKKQFLEGLPKLNSLIIRIKTALKTRKYLLGIDGRRVPIKSAHSALNFLLQGLGALLMKYALVIADYRLQKEFTVGVDYEFVVNSHDEWQVEVREQLTEPVGKILRQAIVDAGLFLDLNCPMDGEYKVGNSWAETH